MRGRFRPDSSSLYYARSGPSREFIRHQRARQLVEADHISMDSSNDDTLRDHGSLDVFPANIRIVREIDCFDASP